MITRDPLHAELERLVTTNNLAGLKTLLAFVQDESKKGITKRNVLRFANEAGESLLHAALKPNIHLDIFQFLFELLKDDEIILSIDRSGCTLVLAAMNSGHIELACMLVAHQATCPAFAEHPNKESWKRAANNLGVTPLHLAARHNINLELLESIMENADIQAGDAKGATPLHYACEANQFDTIARLANAGTDLYDCNHEGKTFLSFFFKFSDEGKIRVFRQLNNEKQLQVLNYFRHKLASERLQFNPEKLIAIEALYDHLMRYRVKAPQSLQELILSKMPYDPDAEFPVIHGLSDEAMRIVPDYQKRVWEDERKEFKEEKREEEKRKSFFTRLFSRRAPVSQTKKEEANQPEFSLPKSKYQVIYDNKKTLKQLIKKIEYHLASLRHRSDYGYSRIRAGIGIGVGALAAGLALSGIASAIACFIVPSFVLFSAPLALIATTLAVIGLPWIIAPILLGIGMTVVGTALGFFLAGVGSRIFYSRYSAAAIYPRSETKELTDEIKFEVVEKLESLQKKDASLLPVDSSVVEGLRRGVDYMSKKSESTPYRLLDEFQAFDRNLNKLKKGLFTHKKPFSVVPEPLIKPPPHHPLPARKPFSRPHVPAAQHWAGFHTQPAALGIQKKIKRLAQVFGRGNNA
jgi:ankyrin repeat protein